MNSNTKTVSILDEDLFAFGPIPRNSPSPLQISSYAPDCSRLTFPVLKTFVFLKTVPQKFFRFQPVRSLKKAADPCSID